MKEILAGGEIVNAFKALNISPTQTYCGDVYQVWEVSDDDFNKLDIVTEDKWGDDWGWWRYCVGSNLEEDRSYYHKYIDVHGNKLFAYVPESAVDFLATLSDLDTEEDWWTKDTLYCPLSYGTLTEYLCECIGASTEKNVCAVAMSLAKLNDISLSELFIKYEG